MSLPRARRLLDQLDRTNHSDRMRTMALLGRDHSGDPGLARLLDELAAHSGYHHRLALVAAAAAGDEVRLGAALRDPSPRTRLVALSNLRPEHLPIDAVIDALANGSAEDRRHLRRFVTRNGLTSVAEAVIDRIRELSGDREAASLLPACSPDTVRRLLPEVSYAVPDLRQLTRRHPTVVFEHLEEELRSLPGRRRDQLWIRVDASVRDLVLSDPDRLLRLVEAAGPSWVLPYGARRALGALIRFDPPRVAALLVNPDLIDSLGWQLPSGLVRNAHRFDEGDQVAIARAMRENESLFLAWIGSLAPSRREDVLTRSLEDLDTSARTWSPLALAVMPHQLRHAEARRMLGIRAVRESDDLTLRYTAYLPFSEAREPLSAHTRRSKAEERAIGYVLLISCARYERSAEAMREALSLCPRLANEQDPVRLAAIQALAASPPSLFDERSIEPLRQLAIAVRDARDTSTATLHQLQQLAFRLLAHSAQDTSSARFTFAIELIDLLADPTGSIYFPPLDHLLPRGAEVPLIAALMPRLRHGADLGRHQLTFALAGALGRRAWKVTDLQQLIESATRASSDSVVRTALHHWLADPSTRSARVERLLTADPSTFALQPVLDAVVRSRQDLLDILLGKRPLKGRFLRGDVRFVPIIHHGPERWLPRQCEAYRHALEVLIATKGTTDWTRTDAIRALARLPEIGADAIEPFLDSQQVTLQEAALGGLAWTDQPARALDHLLARSGTDRARVAVYAATRCARFVPRNELRQPLEPVLADAAAKITARKEAARLLGEHRPAGALDALLAVAAGDVHRDLRVALGRSLRSYLDDDRAWQVLAAMPGRSEDEARSVLETGPQHLAPRHRERYSALVMEACRSTSQRVRAEALASLGSWARWNESAPEVACTTIAELDAGPEWRAALRALGTILQDRSGWPEVRDLVTTLAGQTDSERFDAGAERDRPSAQRLHAVLAALVELPRFARVEHRAEMEELADLLGDRAGLAPETMAIRLASMDWSAPTASLSRAGSHIDDRPVLTDRAMQVLARALDRDRAHWDEAPVAAAADDLLRTGSPGDGALALQLVGSAGTRFEWSGEWRARLRTARSHPVEDVAFLALRIWTAAE